MSLTLPAHHDDHYGGAAGWSSPGARHGYGLRAAPPFGHCDCRRPDLQPAPDSLHHAGHLSAVRPAVSTLLRVADTWLSPRLERPVASSTCRVSYEYFSAVHSQVRRHDTTHTRARPLRRARLWIAACVPSAANRLPDHSGQRDSAGSEPRDHGIIGGDSA